MITLPVTPLPTTLEISCVARDSVDSGSRLDAVGGVLTNGARWGLPLDDAIAAARAGTTFVSVAPDGSRAAVEVVQPAGSVPYLRTRGDPQAANNLATLPECP